ncbi:unnamed protein product [Hyaloperonospora brassicae]|uniref:Uncharacterized protein n=1 Tax=Hyaloperonospora brassicae TaxID=162125 RepID=A0AAV0UI72_HYABA|nr:unnamed protein product [Hyaloperonospora brassicae]
MVSSPLFLSSLDALAPPFYPSTSWAPASTDNATDNNDNTDDDYNWGRPQSPGKSDAVSVLEVPDEELFDPSFYPLSETEMQELAQVDEVNAILAELGLLESHQELQCQRSDKTPSGRCADADVDAEMYRWMAATADGERYAVPEQTACHVERTGQSTRHQPRSVK